MPYQVSQTDTGQFVLMDPVTDTVVIDDDLAAGFTKLEQAVADAPPVSSPAASSDATGGQPGAKSGDRATQGSSAFGFAGGPRYTPILLGVVLPFAWLAVLYFALSNLLSQQGGGSGGGRDTQEQIQALEDDLQALRTELAGAPRMAKKTPPRKKPLEKKSPTKVPADDSTVDRGSPTDSTAEPPSDTAPTGQPVEVTKPK